MKRWIVVAAAAGTLAFFVHSQQQTPRPGSPAGAAPAAHTAPRLTFGEKQERETDYSRTLTPSDGHVAGLIPGLFFGDHRSPSATAWKLTPRPPHRESEPGRTQLTRPP